MFGWYISSTYELRLQNCLILNVDDSLLSLFTNGPGFNSLLSSGIFYKIYPWFCYLCTSFGLYMSDYPIKKQILCGILPTIDSCAFWAHRHYLSFGVLNKDIYLDLSKLTVYFSVITTNLTLWEHWHSVI